jgi:GH25 family lysozyme M1 (1,4-beta-N-acetylmuramidase)
MKSFQLSSAFFSVIVTGLGMLAAPDYAVAQRPSGIDVYYGQGSIDWASVKSSGITFAWTKAAEGTASEGYNYPSLNFTINEAGAKASGVLIGAYYYAHPEQDIGIAGADTEAASFWNAAGPYITNGGTYMMPVLDLETNNPSAGYTSATLSQWVNEWCQDIVAYAAANGVVVKPIVYTFISFANGTSGYGAGLDSTVTQWPLWMANPNGQSPQTGAPNSTSPWSTWTFWQYSQNGSVPGISVSADEDVFNGTATGLLTYVIGGSLPSSPSMSLSYGDTAIGNGDQSPSTAKGTDFGNAVYGFQSSPATFTISNTGNGALNLTGVPRVQFGGNNPNDFGMNAQPSTPVAANGGSTTFQLVFQPTVTTGLRSAIVTIPNDDPNQNPYTFEVQGTAGQNDVSVTVQPNPLSGPSYTVDGATWYGSTPFTWNAGNSHTISTTTPQYIGYPVTTMRFI